MDDPFPIPPQGTPENQSPEPPTPESNESAAGVSAAGPPPEVSSAHELLWSPNRSSQGNNLSAEWEAPPHESRRNFLHNLYLLLGFTLAAFTLTAWILVRVQSPFEIFATGPQEVVRAQLNALDRGELRAAYALFSERYRRQVTFNEWHELIVTHWRMFHAEVLSAGEPAQSGARATLEIHLRGADEKSYRARFTLIRVSGRWWIDDLHWTDDQDEGNTLHT